MSELNSSINETAILEHVPVRESEPVQAMVEKTSSAKGTARKKKADTSGRKERKSFEQLGVDPTTAAELEKCETMFQTGDRLETEVVFIRGKAMVLARAACPTQQIWEGWARIRLKLTRRGAENYKRVAENLGALSARFIEARVQPTVMYALASAGSDKVEAVLGHYEAGGTMTVTEARAFIGAGGADAAPTAEATDIGGPEGIRAMVKAKLSTTLPEVMEHMQRILAVCLESLDDHHRGVRVKKGVLADRIVNEVRLTRSKLENLAFTVAPNSYGVEWRVFPASPSGKAGWGRLSRLLYAVGDKEYWKDPLGDWLIDEIIPALEWGLGAKLAEAVRAADAKRLEAIAAAETKAKAERREAARAERTGAARKAKPKAPRRGGKTSAAPTPAAAPKDTKDVA